MPDAGGYSNTTIGRSAPAAISEKCRSTMSGLSWAPQIKSVAREIDRVLRAVGVDAGDDRTRAADLVQRDHQRALALLTVERRDLGRVAVGDDPGDPAGV